MPIARAWSAPVCCPERRAPTSTTATPGNPESCLLYTSRAAFTGIYGDEETHWEKAWNAITEGNVGSNMNPLGQIPCVKDALSIMQGYEVSRTEREIVSDLIQACLLYTSRCV